MQWNVHEQQVVVLLLTAAATHKHDVLTTLIPRVTLVIQLRPITRPIVAQYWNSCDCAQQHAMLTNIHDTKH